MKLSLDLTSGSTLAAAQQAVCALGIAVGSPLGGYAVEA
jgi:predicted MFS family arabinose efflux permease